MFERFTDRARRVTVLAQEEARLLDHNYIGTEHILLGLIREGEGVGAQVLTSFDLDLSHLRDYVLELIGRGKSGTRNHIPFTTRAKKVLELSLREALQLGHNYIGTEHMLLGLVREAEGVAAQILVGHGLLLPDVRERVLARLGSVGALAQAAGGETPRYRRARRARGALEPRLTDREAEVLRLIGEGSSPFEVAKALSISENTVKNHVRNVLGKLTMAKGVGETEARTSLVSGPACPKCEASLRDSARYRTLDVSPDQGDQSATVLFLYCSSCGVTIDDLILPEEP